MLQYTPHHKKKSSTSFPSFSRASKGGELDDPLTLAKVSMARLEATFLDANKTVEKVSKSRRQAASAVNEVGDQLNTFAMSETYTPLANGFKRLARGMKVDADISNVQVSSTGRFLLRSGDQTDETYLSSSRSMNSCTLATLSSINLRMLDPPRRRYQIVTRCRKNIVRQLN